MVTVICYIIGIPLDIFIGSIQEGMDELCMSPSPFPSNVNVICLLNHYSLFMLTHSKTSIYTSSAFGAKDPDFGRYKLQKLHRVFNRLFGACFVDKKEYNVPQISSLEVLLKPNEHKNSGRTFNRSDFHADRKHDPHSSLEELGNTSYLHPPLYHPLNPPYRSNPVLLSRAWMCGCVLGPAYPSRGTLQHHHCCAIVLSSAVFEQVHNLPNPTTPYHMPSPFLFDTLTTLSTYHLTAIVFSLVVLNSFSVNDITSKERVSTLKAIQQHLMMNPDGTLMPLR